MPTQGEEEVAVVIEESEFIPPDHSEAPGRHRKRRFPSAGEYMVRK